MKKSKNLNDILNNLSEGQDDFDWFAAFANRKQSLHSKNLNDIII